jgi:hypothetical protein
MIAVLGGLPARCVRPGALFQPSHGNEDDRAARAVDGTDERSLLGRRQPCGLASSPIRQSAEARRHE